MKETISVILLIVVLVGMLAVTVVKNENYEAEVQDLNRQLIELRLTCNSQEMIEVLTQLISPLAMDELRLMTEQLKQQKLRKIFKQSEEKSSNEN